MRPPNKQPTSTAMITAPQPEAAEAGAEILREGGTAIDAIIACALTQGVIDPLMCGLGGLGVLQVLDPATNRHEIIDGLSTTPAAATPTMWADAFEGVCPDGYGYIVRNNENELGAKAVTTPGILKLLESAHASYGRLPWPHLFAPAIAQARNGWPIRPHVHAMATMDEAPYGRRSFADKLAHTPDGQALYMEAGRPKPIGRIVHNPALAETLEALARHGAGYFYEGPLATRIAQAIAAEHGLLTQQDLAAFRIRTHAPLTIAYRGRTIALPPPPAGGILIAQSLRILEHFDLTALAHNGPEYIRILAETLKIAGRDKDRHIGDPDFHPPPLQHLLSDAYAAHNAQKIRNGEKTSMTATPEPPDTTTVSAWDANGMVATLTHTLGTPSGLIPPGTGFMLNGAMNWYDPRPDRPGSIAPNKRRFSSMSPTIVLEGRTPVLTIGAPGGAWIGVAILQGLLNTLDWGMTMQEAVQAPRVSATTDIIDIGNRIPRSTQSALESMGYQVRRSPASYPFAALHGIADWDGAKEGGADPQRDGLAIGLTPP